nr:MAG TPA: hypothetical protein [Caudoviricetes sp.]
MTNPLFLPSGEAKAYKNTPNMPFLLTNNLQVCRHSKPR